MGSGFKILGREPAFFVGVLEAALVLLLTFGIPGLDQDNVGVIVATVAAGLGLVTAYATKTTLYSALIGFAKAALVLAVTFGAPLTDAQIGSTIAFITIFAGGFLRQQTVSVDSAISNASPGVPPVDAPVVIINNGDLQPPLVEGTVV